MGWSSAGYQIFDPMADALVEAGASLELKTRVLSKLIAVLQEGDWDCEDESLEKYRDDPAIVAAFAENGVTPWDGDDDN